MQLNFKNWINEEISRKDLENALSGVITQITTTGTQNNTANKNNTTKVISAVGDVNKNVSTAKTDIQKDLENKTKSIVQILTGSNKTPNENERPDIKNKKLADTIAQQVLLYIKANDKSATENTPTTPPTMPKSIISKPAGGR